MSTPALTEIEISANRSAVPEWSIENGILKRTFMFEDFVHALRFVNAVAAAAEAAQHHPDIDIRYNKVTLGLMTHDSGGITAKDFAMAQTVDSI